MLSLTSKTCTKYSMIFFVCSIFLGTLLVMRGSVGIIVKSFHNLSEVSLVFIYYLCCLLSGLSLLFSTGVHSKLLKRWAAFIHFACIFGVVFIFIGFVSIARFDWLIALIVYLLLSIWLLKTKDQKRVAIICLGLPMILSAGFFIRVHYSYLTSGDYLRTLEFLILLSLSGVVGLILAANLKNENRRVKWVLLGINYFFATYFHIVVWIFGL